MLAAASTHTSTGDWIIGIIAVVLFLGFLVWITRRVFRLIAWPFRAMRRPAPVGLGSEYEQMVRAQSKIVLPESRRTRQPEPERRLPFPPRSIPPVAATTAAPASVPHAPELEPATTAPSLWRRFLRILLPPWVSIPLVFLGVVFVFYKPTGASWDLYGAALLAAVVSAAWTKRYYRTTVLYRGERGVVVWIRWGKKMLQADDQTLPPVAEPPTTPTPPAPAASAHSDLEQKLDQLFLQRLITAEEYEKLRGPVPKG